MTKCAWVHRYLYLVRIRIQKIFLVVSFLGCIPFFALSDPIVPSFNPVWPWSAAMGHVDRLFLQAEGALYFQPALLSFRDGWHVGGFGFSAELSWSGKNTYIDLLLDAGALEENAIGQIFLGNSYFDHAARYGGSSLGFSFSGPLRAEVLLSPFGPGLWSLSLGIGGYYHAQASFEFMPKGERPYFRLAGHEDIGLTASFSAIPPFQFLKFYRIDISIAARFSFFRRTITHTQKRDFSEISSLSRGRIGRTSLLKASGGGRSGYSFSTGLHALLRWKLFRLSIGADEIVGADFGYDTVQSVGIWRAWTTRVRPLSAYVGFGFERSGLRLYTAGIINSIKVGFEIDGIRRDFSRIPAVRLFQLGIEVKAWRYLLLLAGFYDGYPSGGVGFMSRFVRLVVAYYGEQLGYDSYDSPMGHKVSIDFGLMIR